MHMAVQMDTFPSLMCSQTWLPQYMPGSRQEMKPARSRIVLKGCILHSPSSWSLEQTWWWETKQQLGPQAGTHCGGQRENQTEAAGSLALWSRHICSGQAALWLAQCEKNKFLPGLSPLSWSLSQQSNTHLTHTLMVRGGHFWFRRITALRDCGPLLCRSPVFQENVEIRIFL